MNAGGVPNTCKSNGVVLENPSGLETGVAASKPCVHRQYAISAPLDFIGLREPFTAGGL